MAEPLIDVAADLQRRGEPFVLATVVRCEAPTSAKPGAKALVHADGRVEGWVGGALRGAGRRPRGARRRCATAGRGWSGSTARAAASPAAPKAFSTTP